MRLLDRYLLREFLWAFFYCLTGFLLFWVAFDLFGELENFQDNNVPAEQILQYYWVKLPEFIVLVSPIALLLALLYSLTNHARHNELTAMRAAGVSLWRISTPYFSVGLVMSLAVFSINEMVVPSSTDRSNQIRQNIEGKKPTRERNYFFMNRKGDRTWKLEAFDPLTKRVLSPWVDWEKPNGARRVILADLAVFDREDVWVFHKVQTSDYSPGNPIPFTTFTNILAIPEFSETPEQMQSEIKVNEMTQQKTAYRKAQLSLMEIYNYRRLHQDLDQQNPKRARSLKVQFHKRLAEPFKSLIVVLVALPFGAVTGRKNVFVGVAASIFICFGYFLLQDFSSALGISGHLPPWLAAWFPNVIASIFGFTMIYRAR